MKKVLVISASPRLNGNSDTLCNEFVKGATDSGNVAEKIFLRDKKINYCTGCGHCSTSDYSGCTQNDDMAEIIDKLIESDVIVLATPIYFYGVNGQIKTFIDRLCAKYTSITNKEFYFIATAADGRETVVENSLGDFKGLMACLSNCTVKGKLCVSGVWQKEDVKSTKWIKEAYEMGKNI